VTELLQYLDKDIDISKDVAEALLAGIFVDTKSFTFQTGVRTFEAASYLRRYGADTVEVKQLFQDDLQTYVNKSSIVSNANIYFDDIAISTFDKVVDNIQVIGAQAADQLLNIKGIKASFVIAREDENNVFISGRSLGKISVQIILERLGGGGHINVAGAQFKDLSIDEVKDKLIKTIEDYKNEEEEK
jgi:c-di-AMP phosphodiesterase-like protein